MKKAKVITSIIAMLTIIAIVMVAIYHANETQKRRDLIATNPELARAMTYGELTEKDEETQSENVRFSVYFARDLNGDGYADRVKGTCKEVEGEDTLYMSLNVLEDGYLKDAKIEIEADNIYFKTALVDDEVVQGNYISENTTTINLKQVQAGTQKLIFGQVRSGDYRYTSTKRDAIGKDTNKYSGINKITLTGTHVKNDGTETQIEKVIEVPVDWYGTTKAEIPYTYGSNAEKNKYQNYNTESIVDEEKQEVNLEFKIVSQESNNKLLLKKSTIEGNIPELNGYKPTKVEVIGDNVQYSYDEETGNFTAYRESTIGEDGKVTKEAYTSSWNTARYSEFKLKVTYPLEAYEQANGSVILNIPVKATFEGYNNKNEEFDNPYVSNTAEDIITVTYERGGGDVITYDVQVGTWVPNPYNVYVVSKENAVKYYNQVQDDTKDTYEVRWYVSRGNSGEISNVELREQDSNYTDKFLKTDGTYEDMLKYSKNIGIYFTTPGAMFGENGWIRVYNDETDELIHEFTSEDWENYTKENPYYYNTPIDHIRIETSHAERVSSFTATSIKEMDNETLTTDKIREEFNKLSKIYSYLSGYAKYTEGEEYQKLKDDTGIANYDEPLSMAQISSVTPTTLSTQETTNMKINIGTVNLGYNVESWKNGTFLLKFPEEVLLAEINSVNINNGNVSILGYDIYEQDGNYFLKILTENENPENYTITIDANITPDPRKISATKDIELYAYNEECNNYKDTLRAQDIYDINGDGNTEDIVDYSKRSVTFVGPSTLLTTETASDYNEEGDELKTTVAPQVAEIDKTQNNRTAKISVQITNNYSGNISGIVVVGKTPFAGNTSQVLGNNLGSTFTAKMTGPIELPENLQGIATVYYSENETVNSDLNDSSNNWKTADEITDFSKIRTYAIDLRDYVVEKSEEYICTYEIEVPQDVNYNDVSYSTHAVYFYLETDEGKLADQTETNKLGFRIARKYNLEINKVKQGTNSPIQGASFSVQEEGEESSRIISSDAQGKINIQDLYVGKVYTVKELRAPSDYVLNSAEMKFTTTVDDNGDLQVQQLEGSNSLNIVQATEEEPAKVSFTVTNEPKYTFKLTKEDQSGNLVQGVRFNLTGKGLPTAGRTVTTNSKGELTITGLYPNEEYTLTEVYAEGYAYSEEPIKFKTVWNGNDLEAQVIEGSFKEQPTVDNTQEKQPIMSATIVNTKLDEYKLSLGKYEKETLNPLEGAIFRVTGKWLDNEYTTDEYGGLEVGPLYEGIEYTIEEIMPPTGYALNDNIIRFVVDRDEEGNQYLQILEGKIKPIADFETGEEGIGTYGIASLPAIDKDGNIIDDKAVGFFGGQAIIGLDNDPLFSLTKIDGETKAPLPNVKFAITKVEDDGTETTAVNSKGEVIGETQEIDGKTYQIITTDEQGRITEDLPEGYYKVVEIETQEGYQLPENEEDRTYFFGIGKTKPAVKEMVELWSQSFEGNGEIDVTTSIATSDGGYLVAGTITGKVVLEADQTVDNKAIEIINKASSTGDGILIKYNAEDKIEWAKKSYGTIYETPQDIVEVEDGYLVLYNGKTINIPKEETVNNTAINIQTNDFDFITVKYNKEGLADWGVSTFGNKAEYPSKIAATPDGGFILTGSWAGDTLTIPANKVANNQEIIIDNENQTANWRNGIVIKYNSNNLIEWVTYLNGKKQNYADKIIPIDTDHGISYIVIYNGQDLVLDSEQIDGDISTLQYSGTNKGIIKINEEGKIEKVNITADASNVSPKLFLNEDNSFVVLKNGTITLYDENAEIIKSNQFLSNLSYRGLIKANDGSYIAIASTNTDINIDGKYTQDGKNIQLTNTSKGTNDIILISINEDFLVEKVTIIGTKGDEDFKEIIQKNNEEYILPVNTGNSKIYVNSEEKQDIDKGFNIIKLTDIDEIIDVNLIETVTSATQYNSAVSTSDGGQIAVGTLTGVLNIKADDTSIDEKIKLTSNGGTDILIAKYNEEKKIDWAINLGGTGADILRDVIKKDDTYIAVGYINGNLHIDKKYTENGEDIDITSSGDKGIIIEFNEEGKIITVKVAEGANSYFTSIQNLDTGGYIIGAKTNTNIIIDNMQMDSLNSNLIIIEFNNDNSVKNLINTYISSYADITNIASLDDGGIVVVGNYNWSSEITIPSEATTIGEINVPSSKNIDGFIVKLNANKKIEYLKVIQPLNASSQDNLKDVVETIDGGYLALWYGYTGNVGGGLVFTEEETASGEIINSVTGVWCSYLIKYNSDNKVEWMKKVTTSNLNARKLLLTKNDEYIVATDTSIVKYSSSFEEQYTINLNGVYLDIVDNGDNTYTFFGYQTENSVTTARVGKFQENTISAEIPEQQEITVENYKKEYKITTEVEGTGGSISGQGTTEENPYEIVKHGEDSTKDIVVTPEEGYKILKITVNGEEINFVPEEDGRVILDKFTNMTSDKHVVVQFSNTVSTVIVHHYKDGTTDKLAEDETLTGEIGTNYTTAPKDIADYEVVIGKLPSNASGQYTADVQEVTYYYKQTPVKFIVHHYLEGTEEIVPGSEDDQINEERDRGTEYTTSPATGIDEKYELVEVLGNPSGTLTGNETIITYYYRVKDSAGVIVHHIDTDTKEQIAPDVVIPATGTGKYGDSYTTTVSSEIPANYEYVTRTENWEGTMVDTLTEVTYEYRLVDPSITNQDISKTATASIDNPKAQIEYGINYTTTIENYIGRAQVTIVDTLPYKIDVAKSSLNGGTYDEENQTITWVELVNGIDTYTTPESGNIEISKTIKVVYLNMDVSKETIENNVSGNVKLLTPSKTSEEVTDTATTNTEFKTNITVNKVWEDNDIQSARRPKVITINVIGEDDRVVQSYDLKVKEGETSHTFTDLPKYNSQGNEIQYTVEEQEKNPGDLHFYTISVGTVENTDENTKEVTITNTFEKPDDTTEVTVTKVWDDNSDEAQKRPESINLQLKNGNATVKEQVVNVSNAVSGDTNTWQYTFTDVEKYNDDGQEIAYTVDETEVTHNDLQFYTKKLEGTTVTNTFTQNTDKVEIQIKKVWEDNGIQAQRRPESIIIVLKANGVENQRYELSEETADTVNGNTWTYTFTELPKYDEYNNIINYTIEEEEKTQGDLKFYTGKVDGTTITNTFTRPTETISIEVSKTWEDQDNVYNKRPTSIRLEVKQGEMVIKSEVVTQDDNWQTTFTDLPKYDENGQEIVYTVDEEEVSSNDLFHYEKQIGEVTDKEGILDEKEATITNTMTKIPSTVEVKYVDKNTGEEISDSKTKEGIIGDTFDVTEDKKDIEGYTLVEEPAEKTGVYTAEPQEKIYYYAKNTRVIVKYLEQDDTPEDIANNKVLAPEVTIEGYEGQDYTTVEEEIPNYTLVATTDNTEGKMQRDEIVVIYYYAPNTTVTVKYLEKDNTPNDNSDNKVLAPEEIINGYVGKDYTTQVQNVEGYTLVETTNNTEGTMTKDPIEVIYYYAQNTKVIVKYLEKDETPEDNTDNQVLAEEITIEGYAGLNYETEQKDIENYTFVETTNNTEGTMTNDIIEVIYYYAQNTKATVQHIDRETGEILKEETQEGKVGDLFETQAEDFEGYVLVESPEEPNIIMDKTGEQVVKYYYAHVSAGVIEKHIDDITGELLYSEEHEGNEGDLYNIPSREFEGYDLVTEDKDGNSRLPENAEGEMKRDEVIEVKYYYIKKAKVIVKYLEEDDTPEDTTDNQVLAEEEIIEGHENDNYETEAKEIQDYNLVKIPENATGTMVITKNPDGTYHTEIEVVYYYKKVAGGVIENHIDITTGNILATGTHEGNVGDPYDIPSREFDGYDLVEVDSEGNNMLPENAIGTMTEEEIVVNYYYIKQAKVKVEYIDKLTGEKLDEEEIQGHIGDSYETEEKEFDGYELVEKPSNSTGEMTEEETVVKYYYQRKAEVEVKYLEKGTEYEIAPSETIEGYVGDNYETSVKDIPYYNFVEATDNTSGTMQKDKILVVYYYEKQVFNLGIDKWVSSVNVNGISQGAKTINNKDEMYVVDIHRSKTDTADIKITYKIRVTNKGEIEGTAGEIIEIIPAGYSYYQEDNNIHWEERDGTLVTNALENETIKPGEYRELEIVLRWDRGENNFGEKENLVILSGETNPAGYEDMNKEDNKSSSDMMITVATGLDRNGRFILNIALQILIFVAVVLLLIRRRRK